MNLSQQYADLADFYSRCLEVIVNRQRDYALDGIPLLETLKSAVKSGVTVEQSLFQLYNKQFSAYERYVRTGTLDSDPIESRLKDAANYLGLFHFYIVRKKELHQAWASHFIGQPCLCHVPEMATYGTHSNQCLRCCTQIWLAHH